MLAKGVVKLATQTLLLPLTHLTEFRFQLDATGNVANKKDYPQQVLPLRDGRSIDQDVPKGSVGMAETQRKVADESMCAKAIHQLGYCLRRLAP